MKKEEFLKRLRSKQVTPFDMPAIDINPLTFDDVKRKFIETSKAVGGQVIEAAASDDLSAIIRKAYPNAKRFEKLAYIDILNKGLAVMDATATSLCMENNIPMVVFNIDVHENIARAAFGEPIGTTVGGEAV